MPISLRPRHLKRYKDVVRLLVKYGRSDLVRNAGLDDSLGAESPSSPEMRDAGIELARDLEQLGPTFVKLGQLLSTRPDILPLPYVDALARLQDGVAPFSYAEVEATVESELGVRISKGFAEFDPTPVAAGSLAQTHRAILRNGRPVAVKVQRPDIRVSLESDLEALHEIAGLVDRHTDVGRRYEFVKVVAELRRSLVRELDFLQEAQNLLTLAKNLEPFDRIVVPYPVEDYSSSRVLTMDYVRGRKISLLSPLGRIDIDGEALVDQLFRAYLQQILVDAFFHADPHPGNVFLTDDGRLALLDLGMVSRVSPAVQERLLQLLISLTSGDSDDAEAIVRELGQPGEDFDEAALRRGVAGLVEQFQVSSLDRVEVGKMFFAVARASGESGLRLPSELTLVGKTLLNLDQIARTLAPDFDPNAAVQREVARLLQQRLRKSFSVGNLSSAVLETKNFVEKLPKRVNTILDLAAKNELKLTVDAIDERILTEGFQKMANRIATGLILSALIVGAAMMMRVETSFRIVGYPGVAMICFLAAGLGGVSLLWSILRSDRTTKKR